MSHITTGESAIFLFTYFFNVFHFYEPKLWKSLPLDIRMASSVNILGRKLKTYSFNLAFNLEYCNSLVFFTFYFDFFLLTFIFYSLIFNLFVVLSVVIFLVLHSIVHCCLILVCVVSTL